MEELSALNFNVREILWKVEEIRQKILKLKESKDFEKQLKWILSKQINSCTLSLLVITDLLNEIETSVDEYYMINTLNNYKVS